MVQDIRNVKAVIFDLWGTLAYISKNEVRQRLREELNLNEKLIKDLDKKLILFPRITKTAIKSLLKTYELERITQQFYNIFAAPQDFTIYFEVEEVLNKLKLKYKLGLISNIYQTTAKWIRKRENTFKLLSHFPVVVFSCEVGYAKPDKRIFLKAISKLKCEPHEALMVGDSIPHDIEPAQFLGMHTILVDRRGKTSTGISDLRKLYEVLKIEV
jgi:putative hydrolase of the HAD superfamily